MKFNFQDLEHFLVKLGKDYAYKKSKSIYENAKDIKLDLDLELNSKLIEYLNEKSDYLILSEEESSSLSIVETSDKIWIIDPLDGSLNFHRNIPLSCISLALWEKGKALYGAIYDMNRQELIKSNENNCLVNDKVCSVSDNNYLKNSILCTGFPSGRNYSSSSLKNFIKRIKQWKKIRAIGSAALSLTWVARGWADAYFEEDIYIWDVAAGIALVQSSGGQTFLKESAKKNQFSVLATNGKIKIKDII